MASSLTTSGFRPPFWPTRTGTSQFPGVIDGSLLTDSDTFNDGEVSSVTAFGDLLEDSDTFFDSVVTLKITEVFGSLLGDSIGVTSTTSSNAEANISHTVNLPAASNTIGRLVIVCISADDTPTFSFPSGWTELLDSQASMIALGVGYRVIDGTEGFDGSGDTITVTTSTSEPSTHISYLVENFNESFIAISSISGTSTNPDPPSITPSGGYDNYLSIAIVANDAGSTTTTAFPSGYTDTRNVTVLSEGGCGIGGARLTAVGSSEDPGTFTISAFRNWIAATISVRSLEVTTENIFSQGFITRDLRGSLFTDTSTFNNGTIYFGTRLSSSERVIEGTSEDPGVYTLSQSQDWIACTVSIKGL